MSAVQASGACYPNINHWPWGAGFGAKAGSSKSCQFSPCGHGAAMRVSWTLKETVRDGDCALDTMLHGLQQEQTGASRQRLRQRIADFLVSVRANPEWPQIFMTCEGRDKEVIDANSAASSWSGGGLGPVPGAASGLKSWKGGSCIVKSPATATAPASPSTTTTSHTETKPNSTTAPGSSTA